MPRFTDENQTEVRRQQAAVGVPPAGHAGEDAHVADLYDAYARELFAHARAIVRSPELAEEVVQQAFANTIVALRDGGEIRHPRRWLHRCVRNLSLNTLRERAALPIENAAHVPAGQTVAELSELQQRVNAVSEVVADLPQTMREVFLLAEVRGLAYDEIADLIGKSVGTVRYQLHRARRTVREAVGSDDALVVGPLLALHPLAGEFAGEHVAPRGSLASALDALRAWLGSFTARVQQLSPRPALALAAAAVVVATPILAPRHAEEGGGAASPNSTVSHAAETVRASARDRRPAVADRLARGTKPVTRDPVAPRRPGTDSPGDGAKGPGLGTHRGGPGSEPQGSHASTAGRVPAPVSEEPAYTPFAPGGDDEPIAEPGRSGFDDGPAANPGTMPVGGGDAPATGGSQSGGATTTTATPAPTTTTVTRPPARPAAAQPAGS